MGPLFLGTPPLSGVGPALFSPRLEVLTQPPLWSTQDNYQDALSNTEPAACCSGGPPCSFNLF